MSTWQHLNQYMTSKSRGHCDNIKVFNQGKSNQIREKSGNLIAKNVWPPWLKHYLVSNNSVSGQWRPWSDCGDVQADLGLSCLQYILRHTFTWCGLFDIADSGWVMWDDDNMEEIASELKASPTVEAEKDEVFTQSEEFASSSRTKEKRKVNFFCLYTKLHISCFFPSKSNDIFLSLSMKTYVVGTH